jgi:putative transposase
VNVNESTLDVASACEVLGLSRSGFYAWKRREPSRRSIEDAELLVRLCALHEASRGTYGRRRLHADLVAEGLAIGRNRVGRLMRKAGLEGVSRRKWVKTTTRDPHQRPAPDLVERNFTADAPDRLWVADITYVPTWEGFLYLAVVMDAWSRKIVGWAIDTNLKTTLVLGALELAVKTRQPVGVVHHSDQGTQYTSIQFGQRCKFAGIRPSMGSVGDAYDNAMCESFFATLECELLDRMQFKTKHQARGEVFSFIEGWYNPRRRHSGLGYKSPQEFEDANPVTPTNPSP